MTVQQKQPSEDLISMIKVAGDSLLSFGELWGSIKKKGASEGFSEQDLQEMLRPYLKQKMDSKKIWYLFHKEEQIERVQTQKRTKFSTNDDKKDTGKTNIDKQKEEEELRKKQEADREQEEYEREMAKARETTPPLPPPKVINLDEVFQSLPDDNSMTCWKIPRISGAALKNKISAWQGNTNKMFRVWMQEV